MKKIAIIACVAMLIASCDSNQEPAQTPAEVTIDTTCVPQETVCPETCTTTPTVAPTTTAVPTTTK